MATSSHHHISGTTLSFTHRLCLLMSSNPMLPLMLYYPLTQSIPLSNSWTHLLKCPHLPPLLIFSSFPSSFLNNLALCPYLFLPTTLFPCLLLLLFFTQSIILKSCYMLHLLSLFLLTSTLAGFYLHYFAEISFIKVKLIYLIVFHVLICSGQIAILILSHSLQLITPPLKHLHLSLPLSCFHSHFTGCFFFVFCWFLLIFLTFKCWSGS